MGAGQEGARGCVNEARCTVADALVLRKDSRGRRKRGIARESTNSTRNLDFKLRG